MNNRWTGLVRHVRDRITRRGNRAAILAYHRIARLPTNPQLLAVTPEHFEEQLSWITSQYNPVSLRDLAGAVIAGNVPDKAIAITFDDGYVDNLVWALPLLKKYYVPATVFITTGLIGQDREFWWDDLERILLLSPSLPEMLELNIRGRRHKWMFDKTGMRHTIGETRWDITMGNNPTHYHRVYRELHTLLKPLSHSERKPVMEELCQWAGVPVVGRPEYRVMSEDEIKKLTSDGLVDVGSHTVTHPMLSALSREAQTLELVDSKKHLEAILGHKILSVSYPFGTPSDIGSIALQLARDAGYGWACANFSGLSDRHTDAYMMPRLLVRDWGGEEFARHLKRWFDGL